MGVQINRPVLDDILVDHGVERERVERLKIMIKEEPHLVPKNRSIIVRFLKRVNALFHSPLGEYMRWFLEEIIVIYETRIKLALDTIDDTLAHECGHFLYAGWKKLLPKGPRIACFFIDLYRDLHEVLAVKKIAKALRKDPRWGQVISSDS